MAEQSRRRAPAGLTGSGLLLWTSTMDQFDLEEHEVGILREACRTADSIDALQAVVDRDGVLNSSPQGVRAHPALVELRAQRLCFAKLLAALAIPVDEAPRAGKRYGIRGAVS